MGFFRSWIIEAAIRPITDSCSDWSICSTNRMLPMAIAAWFATTSRSRESSSVKEVPSFLLMTSNTPSRSSLRLMGVAKMDRVTKPVS